MQSRIPACGARPNKARRLPIALAFLVLYGRSSAW